MKVLLVHGLGRTPCSMFGLGAALRRAGHRTLYFGYSPTLESLPTILSRLKTKLQFLARDGEPVGLAAHSLGGLLLRLSLLEVPELRVHHFAMLGVPNRPPRIAACFWKWRLFRAFTRQCGRFLASAEAIPAIPLPTYPYTVIAGTAGPRHPRLLFGTEPNDGIVAVSETRLRDEDQPRLFPLLHSFIMDDRAVQHAVLAAMMSESGTLERIIH